MFLATSERSMSCYRLADTFKLVEVNSAVFIDRPGEEVNLEGTELKGQLHFGELCSTFWHSPARIFWVMLGDLKPPPTKGNVIKELHLVKGPITAFWNIACNFLTFFEIFCMILGNSKWRPTNLLSGSSFRLSPLVAITDKLGGEWLSFEEPWRDSEWSKTLPHSALTH